MCFPDANLEIEIVRSVPPSDWSLRSGLRVYKLPDGQQQDQGSNQPIRNHVLTGSKIYGFTLV